MKKLACGIMCFATMIASATVTTNLDSYVEYIQSSGTQWIDTGVIGKSTVNMAADVMVLSSAGSSCLIGERPDTGSNMKLRLGLWINNSYKWALNCGAIDTSWIGSISYQNSRCVVSNENGRLWVAVNGGTPTKIHNGANQTFTSSLSLTMFFLNTTAGLDQGDTRPISARVYGLTLHDSGTLVRDFHPCRVTITDTDAGTSVTKYGLWDEINDRFYGDRSGGTDFTAGSDVATVKLVVLPIPDQTSENFGVCRPDCVVSNQYGGAAWIVGGDIASQLFDVEYTENEGAGVATVMVTGKGEYAGEQASQSFNIVATKQEDENILSSDPTARRRIVDGKYVYIFKDPSSAKTAIVKRNLAMTDYLVVGGGGGGGNAMGGGGGGGGVTNATGIVRALLSEGDTFTVSVGAGGAGASGYTSKGANGKATSFTFGDISVSVAGGGGGGSWFNTAGAAGASGGGGTQSSAGGAGIDGLGYAGATGVASSRAGGGGGGAGHEGYQYTDSPARAGNGGEGIASSITGEEVYYGGGGGGGADSCDPGFGGLGGGGDGKKKAVGQPGADGFGGGGGGGSWLGVNSDSRNCGGNGGSGAVILALRPGDFNIESIPDQYLDVGASECTPEPVVRTSDGVTVLTKDQDYTVSYTGNTQSGYAYLTVTGINDHSGKICEISFKIYRRYFVDSEAEQEGDGSEASPFATISNAVEKAKTAITGGAQFVEIRVADGTYEETDIALDAPIVIVGESRDGVEIVDNVAGFRAFTLSHEGAAVRNLTISGNGIKTNGSQGGHVRMTAGLVSNCVIKDGRAGASAGYGSGGNVWMSGGRLERCLVSGGRANWGGWNGSNISYGMGLYASGGIIDSCFFKDNRDDNNNGRNYGSVYLNGAVTMVNCTVTGGYSRYGEACGIVINNASAKVVNSIAYGNYNTTSSTADSNFGNKNLDRYFHCASVITNASCATWTVLKDEDFVNYRTYSPPTQRSPTFSDLQAYLTSEEYENFDWRLRLTSSAIDVGTTDTDYRSADCATLDLDGNARVSGPSIDLGCWEYNQSQLTCGAYLDGYGALENGTLSFHATSAGASGAVLYRWDYGNGVTVETPNADHTYSYPAAGYYTARVQASSDGGSTWSDWFTVPTRVAVAPEVMYVDSNCATPTFPYKTRATAANTLGAAVGVLTNNVSVNQTIIGGVEIVVLSGSRSNDTGMFLATAVTIRGESSDPADAEIVDSVVGSRAFTITHPDVVVSNLTISGSGLRTNGGQGGHLKMTAGLVSNCAIKNGRAGASKGYGNGGNVWMSGGRFERCLVTGGTANWGGFSQSESCGMGLYATGGTIDSCWFKDNKTDNSDGNNAAVVYLDGAATLVNCTVTGGLTRNYKGKGSGIYIGNANAKVVNCIACGNYIVTKPNIYHTAVANIGSANYGRYFYCAAAFTNTSCTTWTVLKDDDLVKFRTFSGTKDTELSAYFGSEEYAGFDWHQRLSSPLVEGGTTDPDYRPADGATLDLDGNPRIAGTSIDIGCWEYAQSQFTCGGSLSKYGALESETVTFNGFAAGPSIDVVFRWDYGNGVTEETQEAHHSYSYPAAGYFTVKVQASPDGGNTWTDWYTVPTRIAVAPAQMFVDSNCATPAFPYKTRATAANTLGAAVGALTNNVSENKTVVDGVDIVVLSGSRSNDTGMFLATAVRIRGESVNPADAEIVDDVVGSRVFTITHPDVVVSNLTISGLGLRKSAPPCNGEGGHIRMTCGLVANCVIKNGRASGQRSYGNGGNIWMSGGRVERCLVSAGIANWGGFPNSENCGMGLYATGGVIDNCFFKDNKTDSSDGQNSASVYLAGAVTMVNCTVTGGWARNFHGKGAGIHIASSSAKAVNCVAYGNYIGKGTITSTAVANFGNANYDRYFYCGAAFTNASCATWTMLTDADFVKYSSFTGSTEAQLKTYFGSEEYSTFNWHQTRHSQLINSGTKSTDYRPAGSSAIDLDGNPRLQSKSIDLGCWEVQAGLGLQIIVR